MILIDPRKGSGELLRYFPQNSARISDSYLPAGDFCFRGHGRNGPVLVGIERKAISDLINSVRDGRLQGVQIPDMDHTYDICYLIVEGIYRPSLDGTLETLQKRKGEKKAQWRPLILGRCAYRYAEFDNWLTSLETFTPLRWRRAQSKQETARIVYDLSTWYAKPWESHSGYKGHAKPLPGVQMLKRPNQLQRTAASFPDIGWKKCVRVERRFGTVQAFVQASEQDLQAVDGIGKTIASRIFKAIRTRGAK